jgi:sulfonate transport system substrate-binding protein
VADEKKARKLLMPNRPFIKIGGVPEHFNLPWVMALEQNKFRGLPAEISWNYYPGGTGAMTQALARGELDIAILLTEGFVSAVHKGLDAAVIHRYISTPLNWGIYSGVHDHLRYTEQTKIAISRKGSGSHLMAKIHSQQLPFDLAEHQFIEVHHLDDAIGSLQEGATDYFYWEHWMTLRFVHEKKIRQIGNFQAPWSGFLVVASQECINQHPQLLQDIMAIVKSQCDSFIHDPKTPELISKRFALTSVEAQQWLNAQEWNFEDTLEISEMKKAIHAMEEIQAHPSQVNIDHLKASWIHWKKD